MSADPRLAAASREFIDGATEAWLDMLAADRTLDQEPAAATPLLPPPPPKHRPRGAVKQWCRVVRLDAPAHTGARPETAPAMIGDEVLP